ncbi:aminotransferase class V-fold PLP-dependent enzyme [Acaryochloris sp. 'Moss Beach']|uniref:aminotransferase class V-fold PLP-dependent enzyme n=1 Tax=Acaryochloris sp. 'Moss Beach' TaxID=2740837 RepID=UPI001F425D08|nr:aminotransferase class V-fold PLP-dependent enzyme [Acaryochloris sp. 'Moss Beach']UJB69627.1 aminotransferase class V-fold PLP-dependent enzyme [Acaryochloris sp. 'Moss Beach']
MAWTRRNFLLTAGLGTAAGTLAQSNAVSQPTAQHKNLNNWREVRAHFNLDPKYIHMAGLLLASHPAPVQSAIDQHRDGLDQNPTHYLYDHRQDLVAEVRNNAADYLGVQSNDLALTDSTTMGTALVINGLSIRPDQEMLTTTYDYYSTHTSLKYKASRTGATVKEIPLYRDIQTVSEDEMVETLVKGIGPKTRLVTATWVHSSTGLKVPIAKMSEQLKQVNQNRSEEDQVLFFVDGVHGLGVEDDALTDLGCDFFVAGTHKWMFAPRGSGFIWGKPETQNAVTPTIPTFTGGAGWGSWMTPGGFKSFEHQWAMAQAFGFHQQMGKKRVTQRLHSLSRQLKIGLSKMKHVKLYTPIDDNLSAAIICFDVEGLMPKAVVAKLRTHNIIASTTPYDVSYARLTPGVYNTPDEIDRVLKHIRDLA